MNAYGVADTIIADWKDGAPEGAVAENFALAANPALDEPPHEVQRAIAGGLVTQYDDWRVIAEAELARGQEMGKERERMGWDEAKALIKRVS